jgi:hypothetical protein
MENDPTEEQIKAEIAAAVKILREDGLNIHKTYAQFQKDQGNAGDVKNDKTKPSGEGNPPPEKTDPGTESPARKGLWWGSRV